MAYKNKINPFDGELQKVFDADGEGSPVIRNGNNIVLNAFRIAINGALSIFNMIDGRVDEYEDESGIDTVTSVNELYDADGDFYTPSGGGNVGVPYTHYKCNDDEANTTVVDNGSGANNGNANTNTSNLSVVGKINDAFEFNNTNEYININSLATDIASDQTGSLAFWVQITDDNEKDFMSIANTGAYPTYFMLRNQGASSDKITATMYIGVTNVFTIQTPTLIVGDWYHYVLVQDGVEIKMYLNGSSVSYGNLGSSDLSAWFDNLSGINAGRLGCRNINGSNQNFWGGKIDDFRYYQNKALTAEEVSALYNNDNGTEVSSPVVSYENMTLISDTFVAETQSDEARVVLLEEDLDVVSLGTDFKAYTSRDDGTTWSEITLENDGEFDTDINILTGSVDISGQPAGTDMKYKLQSFNEKGLRIHANSLFWG